MAKKNKKGLIDAIMEKLAIGKKKKKGKKSKRDVKAKNPGKVSPMSYLTSKETKKAYLDRAGK